MPRPGCWLNWRLLGAFVAPALLNSFAFGQAPAGKLVPAAQGASQSQQAAPIQIPSASGPALQSPNCPLLKDRYVPVSKTIEARVTTLLDSAHLKPGKKIWVNSLFESVDSDSQCHMLKGAVIYGRVTAAASPKKPGRSELGLEFDRADCLGRPAEAIQLTVIAIVAPDSSGGQNVHDALPFQGSGVAGQWAEGWDEKLDPGGPPNFVHPSEVVGFKKLHLDPHGGPACSALLSSTDRNIDLGVGTVLVLSEPETK
jgi:hypothetical protein